MDKKKIILIIEDETALAEALSEKLISEGYQTFIAKNGKIGEEILLTQKPDLILTDIVMPYKDGITMLQDLHIKDIPIIVLTNLSNVDAIMSATEIGADEYLIKSDWSLEDIVKKIKEKIG